MGTPRYWSAFWIVFVGGCSFSASCGEKKVDSKNAEKMLAAKVKEQSGVDPVVTCPKDIKMKKDVVTVCEVKMDAVTTRANVTQTDDQGSVTWTFDPEFVTSNRAEEFLRDDMGKKIGQAVTIDCGPERVRLSEPGKTFRCKATVASGEVAQVEVTITDTQRSFETKLVQ